MKIRRIDIENFRGVRELSWRLPADQTFCVLIGPGDGTKSTILTAVERALSDRWNITFADTDFHHGDIENPIRIRVAVSDLPADLLAIDEVGLHLAEPVDGEKRSAEHTSELKSRMRRAYAVVCLIQNTNTEERMDDIRCTNTQ